MTTTIRMARKEWYICNLCGANHAYRITMLNSQRNVILVACKNCCDLLAMTIIKLFTKGRVNVEIDLALLLTSIRKSYVLELPDVPRD